MYDGSELIEEVQKYPELYNKGHQFNKNFKRKERIWAELSKKFKCDAKRVWTSLRERYVRERKRVMLTANSDEERKVTWELYDTLRFLDEFSQIRTKSEGSSIYNADDCSDCFNETIEFINCASSTSVEPFSEPEPTIPTPSKRVKHQPPDDAAGDDQVREACLKTIAAIHSKCERDDADEDLLFMKYIVCQMRKMDERRRTEFTMTVMREAQEAVKMSIRK